MPSSRRKTAWRDAVAGSAIRAARLAVVALAFAALGALGSPARAEQPARGFAVERLYPSAPGGGWVVMDALDMRGGLGGVMAFTVGYAGRPLRVSDGSQQLSVVSDEAFVDLGFAVTWERWRFYLDLDVPLAIFGQSGVAGGYQFTGPSVDLGSRPDTIFDPRLGVDVRIVGRPGGYFRLGAGAQLFVPSGDRADYDTDGTVRAAVRALFAGDASWFTWAAQLGVHIRPLDDSPAPGSPKGSEALFGVAAGARLPLGAGRPWALIVGPEIFGATALRSPFGGDATALEGLLSARVEGTRDSGLQLRVKLGAGGGLPARFGAPEWRIVAGIEVFTHGGAAAPAR